MNVGGGEAADQLVRMMLSGTEVSVRLGGSALKNMLALTMALAKNNKTLSGKINLKKMLQETRDLRQFPMTPEQYKKFAKLAKKQKIMFSAIRDKDDHGTLVDVILPVTELDRANTIFERLAYAPPAHQDKQPEQTAPQKERESRQEAAPPKKDSRSVRDSPDINTNSSTLSDSERMRRMAEGPTDRPSVEERLKGFRAQLDQRKKSVPARTKTKARPKQR